jgi:ubiquinone/menaquinone biosynthesis C-methylase UbiE
MPHTDDALASSSAMTDPTELRTRQYRDPSNLNARIALHARFSTSREDWQRWVFDYLLAALGSEATVLEVGCGAADLWRKHLDRLPPGWRVTLTDFSAGMVEATRAAVAERAAQFACAVADAQTLPFADASYNAVVANHMLYHVPDRPRTLAELRRVLRPGGTLLAATNGPSHMRELGELVAPFAPPSSPTNAAVALGFDLENGMAQLAPLFARVTLERFADALVVTEAAPLIAYVLSMPAAYQPAPEQLDAFTRCVEGEIAANGAIRITKEAGLFVAMA